MRVCEGVRMVPRVTRRRRRRGVMEKMMMILWPSCRRLLTKRAEPVRTKLRLLPHPLNQRLSKVPNHQLSLHK